MTLKEVKLLYKMKSDAVYRMQEDILIKNNKFIDTSPKYPDTDKDYQKGIVVNEYGWVGEQWLNNQYGDANSYVIQEGDAGFFNIWTYFHEECNRRHLLLTEKNKFQEIFKKSGFRNIKITAIPNEYCQCDLCAPWFDIETEFGVFRIGWRKRVISINWGNFSTNNLLYLFEDEDVTKGEKGIHAWGWDKAEDYLTRIQRELCG
jgi:hypothetical protein